MKRQRAMPPHHYRATELPSNRAQHGVASLPTVLALAILIVAVGIAMTSIAFTESLISAGQLKSTQAYLYAEAGARDALLRIARDKTYSCISADCYSLDIVTSGCSAGTGCAKVTVSSATAPKVITAKGLTGNVQRCVQVNVSFDSSLNGEITSTVWSEVTSC